MIFLQKKLVLEKLSHRYQKLDRIVSLPTPKQFSLQKKLDDTRIYPIFCRFSSFKNCLILLATLYGDKFYYL